MDRAAYFGRLSSQLSTALVARNDAAQAYWQGRGTYRALRRAQDDYRAACNRWNRAVRASMFKPRPGRGRLTVAPTHRPLP